MVSILFIDGQNFLGKLSPVLSPGNGKTSRIDYSIYDFRGLFDRVLAGIHVDRKVFYFGKLIRHDQTPEKSDVLIGQQRQLKTHLEQQGFEVILAGRIRGHLERCPKGHETLTFKEKGVDVRIAVDMIMMACAGTLRTAIIASSDSDLQPAIVGLKNMGVERIYLGFETAPNKGLTFTTNRTILIRNVEAIECLSSQAALPKDKAA